MDDRPVVLDSHRGKQAQKATELRRQLVDLHSGQVALRAMKEDFEEFLASKPAMSKDEAASKAKYLVQRYAATVEGSEPRQALLIVRTLNDLDRNFSFTHPDA